MVARQLDNWPPVRRVAQSTLAMMLAACTLGSAVPASAAPLRAADTLSGTWQVSRTCLSGCSGTTLLTETVRPYQGTVFMATGSVSMQLHRIGKKNVLVHAATSSSLLKIRVPGQLMSGPGIGQDGSVYSITWHCVAPATAEAVTRSPGNDLYALTVSAARIIC